MKWLLKTGCFALLGILAGCSNNRLDAFYAHRPKSILVVPVVNETTELTASPSFITTITQPLAERGYYIFPVYLVDHILRDFGLVDAGHIHQLPSERFFEIFGADAVLFVTIKDWSTKYLVLASFVTVEMEYVLKDTKTGITLWEHQQVFERSSKFGGPITLVVTAAINAMLTDYLPLARQANIKAVSPPDGIPAGPYHPDFMNDQDDF